MRQQDHLSCFKQLSYPLTTDQLPYEGLMTDEPKCWRMPALSWAPTTTAHKGTTHMVFDNTCVVLPVELAGASRIELTVSDQLVSMLIVSPW